MDFYNSLWERSCGSPTRLNLWNPSLVVSSSFTRHSTFPSIDLVPHPCFPMNCFSPTPFPFAMSDSTLDNIINSFDVENVHKQLEQIHMQSPALFASLSQNGRYPNPAFTRTLEYDGRIPPPNRNMRIGQGGGVSFGGGYIGANGLITPGEYREEVWMESIG
jgi:hypothetical protein